MPISRTRTSPAPRILVHWRELSRDRASNRRSFAAMGKTKQIETEIERLESSAAQVAQELQSFRQAATFLSAEHARLIDRYRHEWVGVYEGEVRAHAKTLKGVMKKIVEQDLPKERVIVRHIDSDQRTLIL